MDCITSHYFNSSLAYPGEGCRYQNIKPVSSGRGDGEIIPEMFLFYGWEASGEPGSGKAFLMDNPK